MTCPTVGLDASGPESGVCGFSPSGPQTLDVGVCLKSTGGLPSIFVVWVTESVRHPGRGVRIHHLRCATSVTSNLVNTHGAAKRPKGIDLN